MSGLLAGAAEVVITPPLGVSLAGYYHDRKADDVHDELYARALALTAGEISAAIVICDVIGMNRDPTGPVRDDVAARAGIPRQNVLVCCTHTHTGPLVATKGWEIYGPDAQYVHMVQRKVADAVVLAHRRRRPARLAAGRGHAEGVAFNRRFWMKDGTVRTNPYSEVAGIDRAAGPVDPEVGILRVEDERGEPMALLSCYADHPDQVSGTAISADWLGAEAAMLRRVLGGQVVTLCANGTCGDINHVDIMRLRDGFGMYQGHDTAGRTGAVIAGAVVQQFHDLELLAPEQLWAGSVECEAPLRTPSDADVAWAEAKAREQLTGFDAHGLDVVRAHRILDLRRSGLERQPVEVSVIAMGELAIVGLPGEVFVELGLAVKSASPFRHTVVIELCNDSIGYVATHKAYAEGGYEATSSRFEPGIGELLMEMALGLLRQAREQVADAGMTRSG